MTTYTLGTDWAKKPAARDPIQHCRQCRAKSQRLTPLRALGPGHYEVTCLGCGRMWELHETTGETTS